MRVLFDHITNGIFFALGLMHTLLTIFNQRPFGLPKVARQY